MVFFSAHWCPPCRGFTPTLSTFYTNLKAKGIDFELVFVSSDRDEAGFTEYYSEMPFLALPYSNRAAKDALAAQFKVRGIPSLFVLNAAGETITAKGREAVTSDPNGDDFPWA